MSYETVWKGTNCHLVGLAVILMSSTLSQAQTTVTVPSVDPHAQRERPDPNVIVESLRGAATHEDITAWWLSNSGFCVQMDDKVVLTDPIIELARDWDPLGSEMGWRTWNSQLGEWLQPVWQTDLVVPLRYRLPMLAREMPQCDLVVVSHAHEDHGSSKTLRVLGQYTNAHFCGPHDMKQKFLDVGIPEDRIHVNLPGRSENINGLDVEWTYATHGPPTYASGYLVDDGKNRVYYTGDNSTIEKHEDFPHIMEFRDIDLLILPAPLQYMGGERGAKLANAIDASFVLPSHYNSYEPVGTEPQGNSNTPPVHPFVMSSRYTNDEPSRDKMTMGWLGGNPEIMRAHMKHPERLVTPLQGEGLHIKGREGTLIRFPNPRQLYDQAWPAYDKIVIDGDITEWQRARWTIKLRPRPLTTWGTDKARCAVLWDDENLYVAFDVRDGDLKGRIKQRDGSVFDDDCVEVNLDPHGDRPEKLAKDDYIFTMTVGNVMSDASGPGEDKTWNSGVRHAVQLRGTLNDGPDGDSGYTAEMAFPWKDLGIEPKIGMKIPIDFIVGDRDDDQKPYYYDWADLRSPQTPVNWGEIELVGHAE
ncbi:MAG: MBL fold metallo-hydrolase [Fuerstiella sp.]|nr:MBL fold metallo-hydrolase [Fuerstiella sp.]